MFGKKPEMSETEKHAKMNVLKKIRSEMENAMKSGLGNSVKKVTVASDSEEGLEEGLDKAKEVLEEQEDESTPFSGEETPEEELEEHELLEDSLEEDELEDEESIDAEIERLLAKKKELQSL